MKPEVATDPYTKETFVKRRSNQRFATLKTKNAFHNENARLQRQKISAIQSSLLKNRKILKKMLGDKDEIVVSQDFLLGAEFDFRFYTGTDKERSMFLIYEFEISKAGDKMKIKRRK